MSIAERFEKQVERSPTAVAIECAGDLLTYRELDTRAGGLAQHLLGLGVGPEVMVGICLERSLELAIACLAVLKTGAALVPLETDLPRERLEFILTDIPVSWMLTQSSLRTKFPAAGPGTLCLDQLLPSIPAVGLDIAARPPIKPENLAYAIYISGSTGLPKGVLITQEAYLNFAFAAIEFWQLKCSDRVLQLASFGFDVGIDQLLTPLLAGATVVLSAAKIVDPACFGRFIQELHLTVVHLPAAYWRKWVETFTDQDRGNPLGSLRLLMVGGDIMPAASVSRWRQMRLAGVRLVNRYGPTETTMFTMAYDVPALPPGGDNAARIPIGRPVGPRTVHLLDSEKRPVARGQTGEIYIGGHTLARGYWDRSQLSAERFVPDFLSGQHGARLYRTGDLGRWLADGNLDFIGRADFQIKLCGYRVELGEIEAVLCMHPVVTECAVLAQVGEEGVDGDKVLKAFVVLRDSTATSAKTLSDWLGVKLPDYMVPARFFSVPALPLTPNGKVDRKALEKNDAVELVSGTDYLAPRSQIERDLVEIWKAVLGREKLGVRDNFFHLGGHSLTAVRLTGQVEKVFGCKLPIAALFQSPTIEALARRLGEKDWEPPWSSLVPLRSQGKRPPIFFLHGVGGDVYGFLDLTQFLDPDQPAYGIQAVGLDGRLARHISVEDMASHYVQEIRSFQPVGPYYLSGYSMGGVIAYEVAQQLERGGQRVALLALLDSGPIGHVPWIFHVWRLAAYLPGRCLLHLRQWWGRPNRDRLDYLRGRWAALRYLTGHNRRAKKLVVTAPPTLQVKAPQILGFYDYYHAVAASYRIRRYPGKVDLFVSGNANPIWRHYWKYMARGGVSFHPVAGTHHQIFHSPEHLAVLGESLMSALRRAQGKSTSRPAQGAGSNADFI